MSLVLVVGLIVSLVLFALMLLGTADRPGQQVHPLLIVLVCAAAVFMVVIFGASLIGRATKRSEIRSHSVKNVDRLVIVKDGKLIQVDDPNSVAHVLSELERAVCVST